MQVQRFKLLVLSVAPVALIVCIRCMVSTDELQVLVDGRKALLAASEEAANHKQRL